MGLELPASLSPSKVVSFRDCALAFKYSAIDRLPEPPSPPAAKGTLVHRALELLYGREPADRTIENALRDLDRAWDDVLTTDEYAGMEVPDDFRSSAATLVRRYFDLEDPTKIRPIGLELFLSTPLNERVNLRGIIDRLELDEDGELVVTDYKTGKVPGERQEQGRLTGVHFYSYLCEKLFGRRPARIQLLYLGEPVAIIATPSEQSTRGLERKVGAIWTAIERACERDDFRPRPSALCGWCSFKEHCPAFGGAAIAS
ncbi:MAG: putative RecB family exonuclease [Actinomycetota bacterium]|jgi:putative RecB family exonuclease|nr:putative RecB family exonuclease [Actinomycetota bacterium]